MSLTNTMAEALRLTRSGDLVGATEMLLYGGVTPRAPDVHDLTPTIDLTATSTSHSPRPAAAATGTVPSAKVGKPRANHTARPAAAKARASASTGATATANAAAKIAAALKKAAAVAAQAAVSGKAAAPAARRTARSASHASANDAAGSFHAHTYNGDAGSLGYKLYTPQGAAPGMPLVVMLHGCTQSPDDFAAGTAMNALAAELGFFVAYPGQTHSRHPNKCWNWYRVGDQQRDRGEPALVAGLTRELVADHAVDPGRVYVAGLSAGGAAAAILASIYPDLFAAVGIHSGLACGAAHDVSSALTAMKQGGQSSGATTVRKPDRFVPVITFHGDRDTTVAEINAREIVATAARDTGVELATTTDTGRSVGGRAWTRRRSRDAAGTLLIEQWTVTDSGHAWSGGSAAGTYTDPAGPDASRAMLRFFLER
ncbi:PHB depolymerase family esterase [Sphingosinicellaceae bacterium]|nr:PHB depolymerase family esterase [Sphingosinicellaceae bacterium]